MYHTRLRERLQGAQALEQSRLLLTTGIASAYADLAALYAQRDSLSKALDIRQQTYRFVKARYDAGLETIDSVRQAEARIPQTKSDLAATDEAIMLDKHALAALVGQGPDRALTIARPAVSALRAQGIPADASINLIGRRPDVAAARTRVEAAAERIKEARAAFYPDINIGAGRAAVPWTRQPLRQRLQICKREPRRDFAPLSRRRAPGPVPRSPRSV